MKDKEVNAREKMHSTTHDAASIAIQAGVKKLIIGHYSARYDELEPVLAEARELFPETYLAEEGAVFEI
jgi:ribonuclease Z